MSVLKVGIASFEQIKARTLAIARGDIKVSPSDPKVWVASAESFSKVLSSGNRELLCLISSRQPKSLKDLAEISGRSSSNLSRTLKTMEKYGLVKLAKSNGQIVPRVIHDRVRIEFAITFDKLAEPVDVTKRRAKRSGALVEERARGEYAIRRTDGANSVTLAKTAKVKDVPIHRGSYVDGVRHGATTTKRRKR